MKSNCLTKDEWRKILLTERRRLSFSERQLAVNNAVSLFLSSELFQKSRDIGCYYPINNEFDCLPIIKNIWFLKKNCYLPVLSEADDQPLDFIRYQEDTAMRLNRFNIPEPVESKKIMPDKLDLVLLPLVGFDWQGNRLGMGAGYYDRTFQTIISSPKPILLGLAFEMQGVLSIPGDDWDVRLDGVLTESRLLFF